MSCFTSRDTFVSPVLKYFMFFFNFMFWLAGVVLLALGVWAHLERSKFNLDDITSVFDFLTDVSIFFIITGCLIFMLGFCGCLGALRENTCLIKIYYYTICAIFFAQVGGAIYIFLKSKDFKESFEKLLKEELVPLYTEKEDKQAIVDWVQRGFKCCGMSQTGGYQDWNNNRYYNCSKDNMSPLACAVPASCCKQEDDVEGGLPNVFCGAGALDKKSNNHYKIYYNMDCITALTLLVEDNLPVVGGVVMAIALPQILGIVLSRTLDGQIQDQLIRYRRYNDIMGYRNR